MVKIRRSKDKDRVCNSCKSNGGKFWDVGVGGENGMVVLTLCDTCTDVLLQKLTVIKSKKAEEK